MIVNGFASERGQWKVYVKSPNPTSMPDADLNGTYHGITFTNGFAYVNHNTLGDDAAYTAIQQLGSDDRFRVVEINRKRLSIWQQVAMSVCWLNTSPKMANGWLNCSQPRI